MSAFSDDTRRLCHEISFMRKIRSAFMRELKCDTVDRRIVVSEMRENFSTAHANMARKTRVERLAFISNLKRTVGGKLRAFRTDLTGARQVWLGKGQRG